VNSPPTFPTQRTKIGVGAGAVQSACTIGFLINTFFFCTFNTSYNVFSHSKQEPISLAQSRATFQIVFHLHGQADENCLTQAKITTVWVKVSNDSTYLSILGLQEMKHLKAWL
jgi:hypothetical protein